MTMHRTGMLALAILAVAGTAPAAPRATTTAGYWTNSATWVGGVLPQAGDDVVVTHAVTLNVSTPTLNSFSNTATLTFVGWETKLIATNVFVNGTVTHPAQSATMTNAFGVWVPDNRVSIVCSNLTVAASRAIHGDKVGFTGVRNAPGCGPGGGLANRGGGYGGTGGVSGGRFYGDAHAPTNAGSAGGGAANDGGKRGGHGGGAVSIVADGHVAVHGRISADGESGADASIYVGGGSGGSVFITCRTFGGSSSGLVGARGGLATTANGGGGGGGGRIAIHYDTVAQSSAPTPQVRLDASGGTPTFATAGKQGSLALSDASFFPTEVLLGGHIDIPGFASWAPSALSVSNGVVSFAEPFALTVGGRVTLTAFGGLETTNSAITIGGDLVLTNGSITVRSNPGQAAVFTCGGNALAHTSNIDLHGNGTNTAALVIAGDLSVTNGGTVNFYSNNGTYTNDPALPIGTKLDVGGLARVATNSTLFFRSDGLAGGSGLFRAGSVTVDAGGMISANGQGFNGGYDKATWGRNGFGPGGGIWSANVGGGGGFGGKGGNASTGAAGGNTYGHAYSNAPAQPGSGGASPNNGSGGRGGGAIRMKVEKTLTLNGAITANGNPYSSTDSGAGSGGSVWIVARRFSGVSGVVSANGGNAHLTTGKGGGGGGGRVAIWRTHHDFAGTVTAAPGAAGAGFPGVEGSVVLVPVPAAGTLVLIQ